jgi:hypothetical protein
MGIDRSNKARSNSDEPAFAWWVPYTLRKRDIILSKINARIRKTTHKYGIEIPTSVENAMGIDRSNNNTFWKDALAKGMTEVGVAFEVIEEDKKASIGWSKVTGHLVWDVKMDFTRKARWVLDGHRTPNPIGSTYAGVVSRDSIRIAFTYTALNGVDVFAADIRMPIYKRRAPRRIISSADPNSELKTLGTFMEASLLERTF